MEHGIVIAIVQNNPKRLEYSDIKGQMETIQTTALLRSAKILRRVLEI